MKNHMVVLILLALLLSGTAMANGSREEKQATLDQACEYLQSARSSGS